MPRECAVTKKRGMSGNNRSHGMNATKRRWKANLQKVRIVDEDGNVTRALVSTRALRSGLVKLKFQPYYK